MPSNLKALFFRKFLSSLLVTLFALNTTVTSIAQAQPQVTAATVESTATAPTTVTVPSTQNTEKPSYFYVMSEPIVIHSKLGGFAEAVHYSISGIPFIVTAATIAHYGGWMAAAGYVATDLINIAVSLPIRSYLHLKFRARKKVKAFQADLAKIPHIKSYGIVLTEPPAKMKFVIAKETESLGFLIFQTSEPLPQNYSGLDKIGQPVLMQDPTNTKLRLELIVNNQRIGNVIEVPLPELIDGKSVKSEEIAKWRKSIKEIIGNKTFLERFKSGSGDIAINGSFVLPDGRVDEIGRIFQESSVKKLLNLSVLKATFEAFRRTIPFVKNSAPLTDLNLGMKTQTFECETTIKLKD